MKKIISMVIIVIMNISLALDGPCLYAAADRAARLSGSALIFSPGYINVTKQKTEAIMGQAEKKPGLIGSLAGIVIDVVKDIFFLNNKWEAEDNKVAPELKRKSSSTNQSQDNGQINVIESVNTAEGMISDITIGSGLSKRYDESGRLLSEVIDGKRCVYAGFDKVGKYDIQAAIDSASAGDIVVIKAGTYKIDFWLKNGVSVYGGYNEDGKRDLENTPTIINCVYRCGAVSVNLPTEVNGITFNGYTRLFRMYDSVVTFKNNIFNVKDYSIGIQASQRTLNPNKVIIKNNIFNNSGGRQLNNSIGVQLEGAVILESSDNNFNTGYGVYTFSNAVILSVDDYFAGNKTGSAPFGVSPIINIKDPVVQAHTYSYNSTVVSTKQIEITSFHEININNLYRSLKGAYDDLSGKPVTAKNDKTHLLSSVSTIIKFLLSGKAGSLLKNESAPGSDMAEKAMPGDSDTENSVVSAGQAAKQNIPNIELALMVEDLLRDPSEDQKKLLDIVASLINETGQIKALSDDPEMRKAEEELVQTATMAILAQALPGLLKEGDISNIKTIFAEMNKTKEDLLFEYRESARPYYAQMVKEISKNMAILKFKGILSDGMSSEELAKILPSEIMKIIDRIRNSKDKTFAEKYILRQESKYRKKYLDPNRKILEEHMKAMLKDFTGRFYSALDGASVIKDVKVGKEK